MTVPSPSLTVGEAKERICELGRAFYALGWVSGTGGGISIAAEGRIVMAPSGVQKERLASEDLFELDNDGEILSRPKDESLKLSACAPLFLHAFQRRGAGAVIHSHSQNALLATLLPQSSAAFTVTHLEMMKGLEGVGYHDTHVVPIIENTAHECDLADALAEAMDANPKAHAVLVRRHGVYVWGRDWVAAKRHAECYDYLFSAACELARLNIDVATPPPGEAP